MPEDPRRRDHRRTHLDASAVPVERALLARAEAISKSAAGIFSAVGDAETAETRATYTRLGIAQEFYALAEELHWW